jgi:hypothetical protein
MGGGSEWCGGVISGNHPSLLKDRALADKNAPEDDMRGLGVLYDVEVGVKLKLSLMPVKVSILFHGWAVPGEGRKERQCGRIWQ